MTVANLNLQKKWKAPNLLRSGANDWTALNIATIKGRHQSEVAPGLSQQSVKRKRCLQSTICPALRQVTLGSCPFPPVTVERA